MTTAKAELTKLIALLTGKSERDIALTDAQVAGHVANISGYIDLNALTPASLAAETESVEPEVQPETQPEYVDPQA
jgi:hypothetical protein